MHLGEKFMYKFERYRQIGLSDFNQPFGLKMDPENLILDATCASQKISFPQDISILNEARENLEGIIDDVCDRFYYYKPRMYRNNVRKDYLNLAKCKKRTAKKIRAAIKKQLQYIWRDRKYLKALLGCAFRTGQDRQY